MLCKKVLFSLLLWVLPSCLFADEYHYQDLIVGERAAGLGGAYISIADDPSGIYHNPAGIIYSFENYFSLSANAYKSSRTTYKEAIAGQDYTIESRGWVPNFFGATQNYGRFKLGFAILSPSSEVLDVDDRISEVSVREGETKSLRRRLVQQYSISLYGFGLAYEAVKDLSLGASIFVGQLINKSVNTQLQIFNGTPERYAINEIFEDQDSLFAYPKLGLQWMPAPKWSLGAVVASTSTLYSRQKRRDTGTLLNDEGKPIGNTNEIGNLLQREAVYSPNVLGPLEVGFGASYFPTREWLLSADIKYYSDDPSFKGFKTNPVVNLAFGTEWFPSDSLILRGGIYSNNANTPELDNSKVNQRPHVNYLGLTASVTFANPGSSFTICTQFADGRGHGQIISGTTTKQEIDAKLGAIYITASYEL